MAVVGKAADDVEAKLSYGKKLAVSYTFA